jgi:hypothetical protein
MASLLSEVRERARNDDWDAARALADALSRESLPRTADGLAAYIRELEETLVVARTSRARAVESLARLNAAAGFHSASAGAPQSRYEWCRQEFGETAES